MIGKWFLPLPFIFANKNYTLTFALLLQKEKGGNLKKARYIVRKLS